MDLDGFRPLPGREEPDTVVFTGSMLYPPNIDAVRYFAGQVWPEVLRRRPGARFLIVGRDPDPTVQALAADPSIVVTGRVERIQDWMARAAVIVSPLRHGTGMKNKVLEGAAMGKAMVVSPVSLEDIDLAVGRDLLLAREAGEFADGVVRLLENRAEREAIGAAARQAVERQYAWEVMAERLWACYGEVTHLR